MKTLITCLMLLVGFPAFGGQTNKVNASFILTNIFQKIGYSPEKHSIIVNAVMYYPNMRGARHVTPWRNTQSVGALFKLESENEFVEWGNLIYTDLMRITTVVGYKPGTAHEHMEVSYFQEIPGSSIFIHLSKRDYDEWVKANTVDGKLRIDEGHHFLLDKWLELKEKP